MMRNTDTIDALVAELVPVKRVVPRDGMMVTLALATVASLIVAVHYGLRTDIVAGHPEPMVVLRCGALLLLGTASALAATTSARPSVGAVSNGWLWALGAALLFPVSALFVALREGAIPVWEIMHPTPVYCLTISAVSAIGIGAGLTAWLRKGAAVAANRAGWLVGLAAGAFGTFAYSIHCPSVSIHYVGVWYSLTVASAAGLGRLVVPRLIRW
jgi:hypothetical protein